MSHDLQKLVCPHTRSRPAVLYTACLFIIVLHVILWSYIHWTGGILDLISVNLYPFPLWTCCIYGIIWLYSGRVSRSIYWSCHVNQSLCDADSSILILIEHDRITSFTYGQNIVIADLKSGTFLWHGVENTVTLVHVTSTWICRGLISGCVWWWLRGGITRRPQYLVARRSCGVTATKVVFWSATRAKPVSTHCHCSPSPSPGECRHLVISPVSEGTPV